MAGPKISAEQGWSSLTWAWSRGQPAKLRKLRATRRGLQALARRHSR